MRMTQGICAILRALHWQAVCELLVSVFERFLLLLAGAAKGEWLLLMRPKQRLISSDSNVRTAEVLTSCYRGLSVTLAGIARL